MNDLIGTSWQLMSLLSLAATVIGCMIVVIVLSVRDFHEPWGKLEVRYSVLRERYYFALLVNAVFAAAIYLVLVYLLRNWFFWVLRQTPAFTELWNSSASFDLARTSVLPFVLSAAAVNALLVLVLVPHVWPFSSAASVVRTAMQALARYPHSAETLTAIIGRSKFIPTVEARSAVIEELKGYGVTRRLLQRALGGENDVISSIAAETLVELGAIRLAVVDLQKHDRRFRKFFAARRDLVGQLESDYRRLIRRAARAILAAQDIAHLAIPDLSWDISEFVAEEADVLHIRYHRLIADAALSCFRTQSARHVFLSRLGYEIGLPQLLPLAPLVFVFFLDVLIGLAPIAIVRFTAVPDQARLATHITAIFAFTQAFALALALFWATWPKTAFSFARPSLDRLPWRSYVVFGGISYMTATLLLYVACKMLPIPDVFVAAHAPLLASAVYSTIFFAATCGVSVLLDRRLRDLSLDFSQHCLRDGVTLGLVLAGAVSLFLLAYAGLEVWYEIPSTHWWPITAQIPFVGFHAVLGFAIGYFLPSAAEAHLNSKKIILESAEKDGKLVNIFTRQYSESIGNEMKPGKGGQIDPRIEELRGGSSL
jgi:hypothetical protein